MLLKKLLATTALCTISLAADAQDWTRNSPAAVAAASYNWTGFYAGGNIGYSWGHADVNANSASTFGFLLAGLGGASPRPDGVIGGLQIGYNWQLSRNWVWGLEADFQGTGQEDSATGSGRFGPVSGVFPGGASPNSVSGTASGELTSKLTWLGTVRGRVGFVADGNPGVLWYGTGGLAYGQFKTSFAGTASGTCSGGVCGTTEGFTGTVAFGGSHTKVGWTAGAGIEADLGNSWRWKVEYLYVDLGTASDTFAISGNACHILNTPNCTSFAGAAAVSSRMTDNIIRLGFNRRFGP